MHLAAWSCSRVKFICHERGGVSGGLLLVLPDCRPVCGEPVRSGAGKHFYVKSENGWQSALKMTHFFSYWYSAFLALNQR